MSRIAIVASVVCCLLVASSAPAMEEEKATSKVTIKSPAPSTFKGVVRSQNPVCVKGRSVKLFTAAGKEVSGAVTGKRGNWRVGLEGTVKGSYYAKVAFRRVGGFVCRAARSATAPAA